MAPPEVALCVADPEGDTDADTGEAEPRTLACVEEELISEARQELELKLRRWGPVRRRVVGE